jgi:hypothetical protein
MKRKGIQVLALLPWYSTDTSGWTAYVEKQVQATPAVPAWEVTNEPEMTWWGGPIPAHDLYEHARDAHAVIKAANRDARLVGPAVGASPEGVAYLKSLIEMGLLEFCRRHFRALLRLPPKLAARGSKTNRRRPKTDLDHGNRVDHG